MRTKNWILLSILLMVLPFFTLTKGAADQEDGYIQWDNFKFANLEYYPAHPTERLDSTAYCRPFYAHTNDTVMIFVDGAWFSGDEILLADRTVHQASNSTFYLITALDFDRFWRNESHEKSIIVYEPREFMTYFITVPTDDLYLILALSNYIGGTQYKSYGSADVDIYLIPYGYGGTNITVVNYNTENVNNTNNAYTTVHERAVVTWADAGLIAMICATVIGVVLLRRRR